MNRSLAVALAIVCCVVSLVGGFAFVSRCPLEVKFAKIEPTGVVDNRGGEFWFVTLSVTNRSAANIYFENEWPNVETRVASGWVDAERRDCSISTLPPRAGKRLLVVTPAGANACRLHLKYAPEAHRSLVERLGQHLWRFRTLVPRSSWRFLFRAPGGGLQWAEKDLEVRFPTNRRVEQAEALNLSAPTVRSRSGGAPRGSWPGMAGRTILFGAGQRGGAVSCPLTRLMFHCNSPIE